MPQPYCGCATTDRKNRRGGARPARQKSLRFCRKLLRIRAGLLPVEACLNPTRPLFILLATRSKAFAMWRRLCCLLTVFNLLHDDKSAVYQKIGRNCNRKTSPSIAVDQAINAEAERQSHDPNQDDRSCGKEEALRAFLSQCQSIKNVGLTAFRRSYRPRRGYGRWQNCGTGSPHLGSAS